MLIFDDVLLFFVYFIVFLKDVLLKIWFMCGINLNIFFVLVVMDMVIELCMVIVMV